MALLLVLALLSPVTGNELRRFHRIKARYFAVRDGI